MSLVVVVVAIVRFCECADSKRRGEECLVLIWATILPLILTLCFYFETDMFINMIMAYRIEAFRA